MSGRPPRAFTSLAWAAFLKILPRGSCHLTSTGTTTGKRPLFDGSGFARAWSAAMAGACGKSVKSSYTVNSFWGAPDRCAGPATGESGYALCLISVECVQHPQPGLPPLVVGAPLILQRQRGPTLAEVAGKRVAARAEPLFSGRFWHQGLQSRDQLRQSVLVGEDRIESGYLRYPIS